MVCENPTITRYVTENSEDFKQTVRGCLAVHLAVVVKLARHQTVSPLDTYNIQGFQYYFGFKILSVVHQSLCDRQVNAQQDSTAYSSPTCQR